jgi:hypothetical protein
MRGRAEPPVRGAPDCEECLSGAAPDCPVPLEDKASNGQKLLNPNGWVTWLAHRTVRCAPRQQPPPTAINTPNHHHSKYPSFQHFTFNTRASAFTLRHNSIESKPLQVPNPLQPPSDLRECFVRVICALVAWIAFFLPRSCSQVTCNQSKIHQVCGGPCGV